MGKLVKIFIFFTALTTSAFSSPPQLYYEKAISDAENIVHVEPLFDSIGEFAGYIYTNNIENKIYIKQFELDSIIVIEVPTSPVKSIVRYSELRDTLYIYTLSVVVGNKPQITISTFFEKSISQETIVTNTDLGNTYLSMSSNHSLVYSELKFYPNNKSPNQIIFACTYNISEYFMTIGSESHNASTSIIYSLDLSEISFRNDKADIFPSKLFDLETVNYVFTEMNINSHDYRDQNNEGSFGAYADSKLLVYDNNENLDVEFTTSYNEIHSVHIDNFAPSSQTEELIIHANSEDLLRDYVKSDHIACYSFTSGTPTELWYNDDVNGIDFSYVYNTKDLLVGVSSIGEVVMLNYLNGEITDLYLLDVSLSQMSFFETGNEQSMLNLIGLSGDTIKVFRFDISTGIQTGSISDEIPKTFTFLQNHPNPFNGETRLEFTTDESQYLRLSIFNILGQEIKLLAASKFSSGTYSYYWNGSDENGLTQSTGIYFARLESESASEMIKLIYLK